MDTTRAMRLTDSAAIARHQTSESTEFRVPSCARAVARVRSRVRGFANTMGFTSDELDDISIAVGEAATNAIRHAHNPAQPYVNVKMRRDLNKLVVSIADAGPGFDPSTVCAPGEGDLRECGRGIMCMRVLMDEVVFQRLAHGTMVELTKTAKPSVERSA